jgi:hypothetical protein
MARQSDRRRLGGQADHRPAALGEHDPTDLLADQEGTTLIAMV